MNWNALGSVLGALGQGMAGAGIGGGGMGGAPDPMGMLGSMFGQQGQGNINDLLSQLLERRDKRRELRDQRREERGGLNFGGFSPLDGMSNSPLFDGRDGPFANFLTRYGGGDGL